MACADWPNLLKTSQEPSHEEPSNPRRCGFARQLHWWWWWTILTCFGINAKKMSFVFFIRNSFSLHFNKEIFFFHQMEFLFSKMLVLMLSILDSSAVITNTLYYKVTDINWSIACFFEPVCIVVSCFLFSFFFLCSFPFSFSFFRLYRPLSFCFLFPFLSFFLFPYTCICACVLQHGVCKENW